MERRSYNFKPRKSQARLGRSRAEVSAGLTEIKVYDKSNREAEEGQGEEKNEIEGDGDYKGDGR